ncbi:tyrosine-type recombinase/integrase [Georgenia thermotolerans]|uniref:tyrosine-type recombinase/integrase n=1 Tax=Georgenia thermotolerans TaxID=527326 RepID=UPI001264F255|nr:site-specific integrase [Georgenia thermotolerans]
MASIRQRTGAKGTTWAVLFRDDDGRQTSETFPTNEAAEEFRALVDRMGAEAARRILAVSEGLTPGAPRPQTVAEYLTEYIHHLTGIDEGTRTGYRQLAKAVTTKPIGAIPLSALERRDVVAWIRDQESSGLSQKTVINRRGLLSAALARAVEDQIIPRNPAYRVPVARTERQEMVFLTPAEFQILKARATPHFRPFLDFLVLTGLRFGEATALQARDLHLEDSPPTLSVVRAWKKSGKLGPPKTKKARRTISLPPEAVTILREAIKGKAQDEWVFTNTQGRRILQNTLWGLWVTWLDDTERAPGGWGGRGKPGSQAPRQPRHPLLGKKPRIHDLRHTHASWMLAAGISLHDLRHRLGHESIQTTSDTYGHLMPEAQIQAARAASLMYQQGLPRLDAAEVLAIEA